MQCRQSPRSQSFCCNRQVGRPNGSCFCGPDGSGMQQAFPIFPHSRGDNFSLLSPPSLCACVYPLACLTGCEVEDSEPNLTWHSLKSLSQSPEIALKFARLNGSTRLIKAPRGLLSQWDGLNWTQLENFLVSPESLQRDPPPSRLGCGMEAMSRIARSRQSPVCPSEPSSPSLSRPLTCGKWQPYGPLAGQS